MCSCDKKLTILNSISVRGQSHGRRGRNKIDQWGAEQKLLSYLFREYDTDARGVDDIHDTVTVKIELLLLRIQGLVSISLK